MAGVRLHHPSLRSRLFAIGAFVGLSFAVVPTQAIALPEASFRIEVSQPVSDGAGGFTWQPIPCDGSAALDGVGEVRALIYGTSNTYERIQRVKVGNAGPGEWYQFYFPRLLVGQETLVAEVIFDLWSNRAADKLSAQLPNDPYTYAGCNFSYTNLPAAGEGFRGISHRTTPTYLASGLRIEVLNYKDSTPVPCGSTLLPGRIRVRFYATTADAVVRDLDFHSHIEMASPFGRGPDQDGNPLDRRNWETSMDHTPTPNYAGSWHPAGAVGEFVQNTTGTRVTVHFAQQTPPGMTKNEVFCSFGPGV